jgi:hypothetical protein
MQHTMRIFANAHKGLQCLQLDTYQTEIDKNYQKCKYILLAMFENVPFLRICMEVQKSANMTQKIFLPIQYDNTIQNNTENSLVLKRRQRTVSISHHRVLKNWPAILQMRHQTTRKEKFTEKFCHEATQSL